MTPCIYCGLPTPRPPACVGHRDLPALDPAYGLALKLAKEQYPALMLADRAPAPKVAK